MIVVQCPQCNSRDIYIDSTIPVLWKGQKIDFEYILSCGNCGEELIFTRNKNHLKTPILKEGENI